MNRKHLSVHRCCSLLAIAALLTACGGGGSSAGGSVGVTPPVASPQPVGGKVAGIRGVAVLSSNGQSLDVAGDGSFQFATALASGTTYAVTVSSQPIGQTCTVTRGSGTIVAGAITDVQVNCSDTPGQVLLRVFAGPGQAMAGASVMVQAIAGGTVYSGKVDATGGASVLLPTSVTGPFLAQAVLDQEPYYDIRGDYIRRSVDADPVRVTSQQYLWRALFATLPADKNVAVTPLTEVAAGRALLLAGKAPVSVADVTTANAEVASAFGINDLLQPPSLLKSGTKLAGTSVADRHALTIAGLMKMAYISDASMTYWLREDYVDGKLDGRLHFIKNAAIDPNVLTVDLTVGATPAQLASVINAQIAQAAVQFSSGTDVAPTVSPIVLEGRRFYRNGQPLVLDFLPTAAAATPTLHNLLVSVGINYLSDSRTSTPFTMQFRGQNCNTVTTTGLPLTITSCDVVGQAYRYHIIENTGLRSADVCWQLAGHNANVCELQVLGAGGGATSRVQIVGSQSYNLQIIGYDDRTSAD